MKKGYLILFIAFAISNSGFAQKTKANKAFADSLVNQWNIRFNSDNPEKIREILGENVNLISGDSGNFSRDSVMKNFIEKRMPVISELNAVNKFYSISNDIIYTAGGYTLKVTPIGKTPYVAEGNYTLIWHKHQDNKFRIEVIHIENLPKK